MPIDERTDTTVCPRCGRTIALATSQLMVGHQKPVCAKGLARTCDLLAAEKAKGRK